MYISAVISLIAGIGLSSYTMNSDRLDLEHKALSFFLDRLHSKLLRLCMAFLSTASLSEAVT